MKLNDILKNNEKNKSKKSKDSLYKYNISNYHKKTKTEININEEKSKPKTKITIKGINSQNNKLFLFPDNSPKKIIKKFHSVYPLCSPKKEDIIITKAKKSHRKSSNINNNIQLNNLPLSLKTQNINYNNYVTKERNTFGCKDKENPIKKIISNTSLSFIQKLKGHHSIEYHKKKDNLSIQNISIKSNKKKEYLDFNKIMKKEKKMNLNKLSVSKSSNNFLKKNPMLLPKYNQYNDSIMESSELKNPNNNVSYMTVNNGLLLLENKNQCLQKFNSFNSNASSSIIGKRNNNKKATIGQYYVDIDLSLNSHISKDNENKKNELINNGNQVFKKTVNTDFTINSELKSDTNIFHSPIIEKTKKPNTKNIIDLRNTNYFNKKKKFYK